MNCPKCKTPTRVINTASDGKYVFRQRVCKECGYRFYSLEAADDRARYYLWKLRSGKRTKAQKATKANRKGRRR